MKPVNCLLGCYCLLMALAACRSSSQPAPVVPPVDTSITSSNAFIPRFFDSASLYSFMAAERLNAQDSAAMLSFYHDRNYQFAWFDSAGVSLQARHFANLYCSYRESVADSSLFVPAFDSLLQQLQPGDSATLPAPASLQAQTRAELLLTRHFFRYAERAYAANRQLNLKDLGWFIPKKKLDARGFLDTLLASGSADVAGLLPVHPLFENLRRQLARYLQLQANEPWPAIDFGTAPLANGDSSSTIAALQYRLWALGDLAAADTGARWTNAGTNALRQYQQRMGLPATGELGPATRQSLNEPLAQRIRQLRINLERARWVPRPGLGRYLVVNIPEFKLHAYDSGRHLFDMNVVVGKPATNTVIFNGLMKYVVFAPYWNVPYSIVKNEMGRTEAYFKKRNMEVVGRYADGLPMVRQKPGPGNSLGKVKFLFPNSYSIYLHDTPSKSLFGENKRAFSHGCIRVANPPALAAWVLQRQPGFDASRIKAAMDSSAEWTVTVKEPIPVFVGYFTCWVDQAGLLQCRPDLYGHDEQLAARLFGASK
ncbi:MAG: L,D-transpeptidase family protein [Chitinophagaceae bacterium]|jgi:murein L,D-transpeptidase YcbB/YkuD|nr:L,D-transpeptidase family protein [Chitinophagaceae bacterium]